MDAPTFFTVITRREGLPRARLAIESLQTFGGQPGTRPIWVFDASGPDTIAAPLAGPGIEVLPLDVPAEVRGYWFAAKVAACAEAEHRATAEGGTGIVWMAGDCLIIRPPTLLTLGTEADIAIRPVHHRNIGLAADAPLDAYWRRVYASVGVTDIAMTVRSSVGQELLRAYFNTHIVAINPGLGLCARWYEAFAELVNDADFQSGPCSDVRHRIFLHQAPLSALIATSVDDGRIRLLPPDYSYPYNLHDQVPPEHRAKALNDLVCAATEDRPLDPEAITDIEVQEPLRSWLSARSTPGSDRRRAS
jgi:hypothetical protein